MKNNVIRIDFSNMYTRTDWTKLEKADFLMALYELQNIQKGDYICLACIKGWEKNNKKYKGRYYQTFIQYSNSVKFKKKLEKTIKEWELARYDIYFGSSIFNNQFRRLNEISPKTKFIAVDIDSANYKDFDLLPYLVWESSPNSYQAIYMLEEENRTNTELIKKIKGLQEELNKYQDKKKNVDCGDGARVLRLPGTRNYKPKRIEENGGKAPLVGNLKFLNKTVNPQLENFKNSNKLVSEVDKGIELNRLLVKYDLIDKKDYIENIIKRYEEEADDRSSLIHQFVGDMIGLGFELRYIVRLSLWLIENNKFPSLYSKIEERGNDFNKSLSLFLSNEFNGFINKGRKLGDSLVNMNVVNTNNRKESSMLIANKINMDELKEEKVEFFIDDFLVKKSITILSGDPGIGKTTLGNLVAAIGEGKIGKEYFGDHRLIENFNSWIINFENKQDSNIASAVKGIGNYNTNIRTTFCENTLDFEKQEQIIKETIKKENITLLILDPLTALMESITDGKLINNFFQFLRRLRDELGITILCITHNIKTNKDSISFLRTDPLALVGGSAGFGRFAEYLFVAKKYIEEGEEENEERQNNMTKDELRKLNRPIELTLFKVKCRAYNYLHKHYRFSIYHKSGKTTIEGKSITRTEALEIKDINSRRKEEAKDKTISELADFFVKCEKGEFTSSELKEALGRKPYERFSDKRNGYAKKLIDKGIIEFIKGNRKNKEKNYYKITMPAEEIRYKVCETLF